MTHQVIGHYLISGIKIDIVKVEPMTDPRFNPVKPSLYYDHDQDNWLTCKGKVPVDRS